jgi:hypothetical protein
MHQEVRVAKSIIDECQEGIKLPLNTTRSSQMPNRNHSSRCASTPADMQANDTRFVLCHSALTVEANARV